MNFVIKFLSDLKKLMHSHVTLSALQMGLLSFKYSWDLGDVLP